MLCLRVSTQGTKPGTIITLGATGKAAGQAVSGPWPVGSFTGNQTLPTLKSFKLTPKTAAARRLPVGCQKLVASLPSRAGGRARVAGFH